MAKLSTQREIAIATDSVRSLKTVLNSTNSTAVGIGAEQQLKLLGSHVSSASTIVDAIRQDVWNPQAVAIVREYDACEKAARNLVADLNTASSYRGPCRGLMSTTEKTQYIAANGQEKFLSLPY